ncbi:MAG: cupin domain-containing protein [Gammaproteobacteria bacterium]|nr:cupin domain-containing protein [Gammaproteobacteria bacterium]
MLVKKTMACPATLAIDGCEIREVIHPAQDPLVVPYSLAVAEVAPGTTTHPHRLQADEVYYLLEGAGRMHIEDDIQDLIAGDVVYIPANRVQWIENSGSGPLRFIALVSPPWSSTQDERVSPGA